ncbi:DUF5368 family protein [Spiribacter pallidus]|uniref:DUF5368 family protein n=1 Tax=Spiribacter pallidus TaxID=1987936 RepID=A0ABV3T9U5_9GAMM
MEFSIFGILAVVLELFRPLLLPMGLVVAADLLLFGAVIGRHRRLNLRAGVRTSLIIGAVAAAATAFYLPAWTGADLSQLSSMIDYAGIIGGAIGVGVAIGLLSYPPVQLLMRRPA